MAKEKKLIPIMEAQKRTSPFIDKLCSLGARCMEQTLDRKDGVVCERWMLPNGRSVVIYATPLWCDAFFQCSPEKNSWDDTYGAIDLYAAPRATGEQNG